MLIEKCFLFLKKHSSISIFRLSKHFYFIHFPEALIAEDVYKKAS